MCIGWAFPFSHDQFAAKRAGWYCLVVPVILGTFPRVPCNAETPKIQL